MAQATQNQVNFIHNLTNQAEQLGINLFEEMGGVNWECMWDLDAGIDADGAPVKYVSVTQASNVITELLGLINQKNRQQPVQQVLQNTVTSGIYQQGEQIYKVQQNKMKTNVYAKKMVFINGRRLTEGDEIVHFEWEYAPGVVKMLRTEDKLNADQVGELGLKYGQCMVCGRGLKDAFSVKRGIGPVCYKNYGEGIVEETK